MSFIQLQGLNDIRAPEVIAEGRYALCVVDAKVVEKEGKVGIRCLIEIEEPHPTPGASWATMFHHVSLPTSDDDADKATTKLRMAKQFFVQFGVPVDDGVDVETIKGCRADGNVKQDEYEGTVKNILKVDPLPQKR